jgi:hypothetical protein
MGQGNWFPSTPNQWDDYYRLIYVDMSMGPGGSSDPLDLNINDEEEYHEAYVSLIDCMSRAMYPSMDRIRTWYSDKGYDIKDFNYSRDTAAVFASELISVVWDTAGEAWHQGIGVCMREYAEPNLARRHVDLQADKLFAALNEVYHCSVRTSPWTSVPYAATISTVKV